MATWNVEISAQAKRQLDKLDPQVRRRIEKFLYERIAKRDNPRSVGEALQGSRLGEFWRYRVGDYRILSKIEDDRLIVLVLIVGHRSEVYERA